MDGEKEGIDQGESTTSEVTKQDPIIQALNWFCDQAIDGLPRLISAEDLAKQYLERDGLLQDKVRLLIRAQTEKAAALGLLLGSAGLITLPIAIPADLASVLFIQLRMVAAIAYMGDPNITKDEMRTFALLCLTGHGTTDILREGASRSGEMLATEGIKKIPGKTLIEINKRLGRRFFTKFGQTGVINLGKWVPLVGGIVGAAFDGGYTYGIGNAAKKTFIKTGEPQATHARFTWLRKGPAGPGAPEPLAA